MLGGQRGRRTRSRAGLRISFPACSIARSRLAVAVADAEAIATARSLAHKEGIFCGISSGGTFRGAREVAKTARQGQRDVAMLPDTGERYLSTPLFEGSTRSRTRSERGALYPSFRSTKHLR